MGFVCLEGCLFCLGFFWVLVWCLVLVCVCLAVVVCCVVVVGCGFFFLFVGFWVLFGCFGVFCRWFGLGFLFGCFFPALFLFFFCKNLAQMSGGDQPGDVQAGTAGTHHNSCCMETYVSWSLVSWSKAAQIRVFKPQRTAREGLGKVHFGIRLELGKD